MSLKQRVLSVITLIFAVAAFSIVGTAQDKTDAPAPPPKEGKMGKRFGERGGGMKGKHGPMRFMREFRELDLTESQRNQIKSLMDGHHANFAGQHDEIHGLMMKKRDGSITDTETARLTEFHDQMKASAEQLRSSVMALLTPEQTVKLEQIRAERKLRMEERKQRKMERRGAPESKPEAPKTDN